MELRDIVAMLRAHWAGIVVLSLLGVLVAGGLAYVAEPEYRAQATVLVTVQTGESIADLAQGSSYVTRQVQTYAEVARSPKVLDPVVEELHLRTTARALRADVLTTVKGETPLIDISVTRPDGAQAAAIADAVSRHLAVAVNELSPTRADGTQSVMVDSISPAVAPDAPYSPDLRKMLAFGLLLGLVLGLSWAALRTALDTKVRTRADIPSGLDTPILGTISYDGRASARSTMIIAPPLSNRAEEYRQLRTNLQFVDAAHRPRSIVVTSSRGGEGKSVTTLNLALALAETGSRVCLVDADLRRPSVAGYLGIEGSAGLTTVLIGRATIDDVLQPIGTDGLTVLTSGQTPPNPSELLASEAMAEVVAQLVARFDIVLFDSAPLLPVTDAAILSKVTDGVVLIAGAAIVSREQLGEAAAKLETIGSRLLGVVINRARVKAGGSRTYGYQSHVVDLVTTRPHHTDETPSKQASGGQHRAHGAIGPDGSTRTGTTQGDAAQEDAAPGDPADGAVRPGDTAQDGAAQDDDGTHGDGGAGSGSDDLSPGVEDPEDPEEAAERDETVARLDDETVAGQDEDSKHQPGGRSTTAARASVDRGRLGRLGRSSNPRGAGPRRRSAGIAGGTAHAPDAAQG